MASKTLVSICVLVVLLNVLSTYQAHANWFGKRGDQEDILGYLLKRSNEHQQDSYLSAESAMQMIERVVMKWSMARKMGMATPTEK